MVNVFIINIILCVIVMSDVLSPVDNIKFQDKINFTSQSSPKVSNRHYVNETEIVLTLSLSSKFLSSLHSIKSETGLTYIQIVNTQLIAFQLKESSRLEKCFRTACSRVVSLYKSVYAGGLKRQKFNVKEHGITVFKSDIYDVKFLNCKISEFDKEKVLLEKRCKELYMSLVEEQKKNENFDKCKNENDYLVSRNEQLSEYVKTLEKNQYLNSGKKFDDCQPRQRYRKIKTLETYVERALAFADTFGITPLKLSCVSEGGQKVVLDLDNAESVENSSYQNLNAEEKDKLKQIVFLLDKFCISDSAYHELSMIFDDMPRKYLIVQCREEVGKIFHIERMPGNMPGAMLNLNEELERIIKNDISKNENIEKKYKIKFSGDGTQVSKISNYVIFSVQIVSKDSTLSYHDLNTIAIVKCNENYENLKLTCHPLFHQVSELAQKKVIVVDGTNIEVEVFVGGDMKFLQLLLGLNGSTGNHACPWCKVHKDNRYDVSKPWNYYHSSEMARTHEEICSLSYESKNTFGVKHKPLVNIDIEHVVPDELHLMLRVTDVLLRNIIFDCKDKDDCLRKNNEKAMHVDDFVNLVQSCSVSFHIWTPKGSSDLEWTSLAGCNKIKLLKNLPDKLLQSNVLHDETKQSVVELWKDFYALYLFILSDDCESSPAEDIFGKMKKWLEHFLSLGEKRKGYLKINVTPYLHCFVYHVPFFLSKYGSLKKFSNQGVEKNNDIVKMIHMQKCAKWDGPTEALKVRKRLELSNVENLERQKRQYVKQSDYWNSDIFVTRRAKRRLIDDEMLQANVVENAVDVDNLDVENMSDNEIKDLIYAKEGKKTKIRNRQKLVSKLKSLL